jgi:putative nucleotidyltransferase with HDIG domain
MNCRACEATNDAAAQTCYRCGTALNPGPGWVLASRYEILSPLGTGGMGTVYKARDRVLDEIVALKVLRPEIAFDPDMTRRFQLEIKLARRVTHKNVCRIHEYGEDAGLRYLSMEFIAGTNLRQVLLAQGGLLPEGAIEVALEIAAGLTAIHEVGVIHRDLKTPNIMLDSRGVIRLMDFGIAKAWGQSQGTGTGLIVGTPEYMSPEQATGGNLDFRSDLYALGIVIFELFTGNVPFHGDSPMATLYKQVHEDPPLDGPHGEVLPKVVVPLLRKALAKDPAERYASVAELSAALARTQAHLASDSVPPEIRTPPPPTVAAATPTVRAVAPKTPPQAGAADGSGPLLEAIEGLDASLSADAGLEPVLEAVVTWGKRLVGASAGRVMLMAGVGDEAYVESSAGDGSHEVRGARLELGRGIAALALETGAAVRAARPAEHPRYSPPCDEMPGADAGGVLCVPLRHSDVRGALVVAGTSQADGFTAAQAERLARFARHAVVVVSAAAVGARALDGFTHTADVLVSFLERIDVLLASHSRNVAALVGMVATRLGMSEAEQIRLHFAALLHDVGKLRVQSEILRVEGPLTDAQRQLLHEHVVLGIQLLAPLTPWPEILDLIHAHHERWDGRGYPRGLAGEAVPLGSRLISVADVFDAMTSRGVGTMPALKALEALAGTQLDPKVVQVFVAEQKERLARFQKR